MRTSRDYAETARGLLIEGCGFEAQNVTDLNAQNIDENAEASM